MKPTRRKFIISSAILTTTGIVTGYLSLQNNNDDNKFSGYFNLVEPLLDDPVFIKQLQSRLSEITALSNDSFKSKNYEKLDSIIQNDFKTNAVYKVNDWLLSETELILFYINK